MTSSIPCWVTFTNYKGDNKRTTQPNWEAYITHMQECENNKEWYFDQRH